VLAVGGVEEEHGQGIDTAMEALVPILRNLKKDLATQNLASNFVSKL